LPLGQQPEHAVEGQPQRAVDGRVADRPGVRRVGGGELHPVPPAAPAADLLVVEDLAHVRVGRAGAGQPAPVQGELDEGRLQQVARVLAMSGEQHRDAEQGPLPRRDVLPELLLGQ
jgi:hypothetical protein